MFQLFKERNFNDYINDTFQFFKILGKHYFKNYFTINGGLLLLITVFIYFFTKVYFDFITSAMSGGINASQNTFGNYFNNNIGLMIAVVSIAVILIMVISIIQFAFPVVYLDLYDQHKGTNFTTIDILNKLKSKISKIIIFVIGSIFVIFPILTIVAVVLVLLCFIIIGIPLLLIMLPAIMSWIHLSFYYYMNSDEGFFKAIGDGFDTVKQQFWPIVGTTVIMYIIIQTVNTIFTMIPYLFGMASMFSTISDANATNVDRFSAISVMISIVMVVSTIISFILNNLILINQGMIYYSHIEGAEGNTAINSIDLIGTDSE
ncbi:hypothetical protein [Flavobacterium sp.]|uniref:hypothetical protein n=1 Tax=Flavobacterium sp. TaxID=239 RepID=UPI0038FCA821